MRLRRRLCCQTPNESLRLAPTPAWHVSCVLFCDRLRLQVELKTGETYRGTLVEAEDNWNSQMKDITVTGRVRGAGPGVKRVSRVSQPKARLCSWLTPARAAGAALGLCVAALRRANAKRTPRALAADGVVQPSIRIAARTGACPSWRACSSAAAKFGARARLTCALCPCSPRCGQRLLGRAAACPSKPDPVRARAHTRLHSRCAVGDVTATLCCLTC